MQSYQIYERETKTKGIVYDIVFRIETEDGVRQKRLYGYETKKLAKQAHQEYVAKHINTPEAYNKKKRLTFDFAYEQYLVYIKTNLKESSVYTITHTFQANIIPFFQGKDLNVIKEEDIYAWQDNLWAKRKSNGELYSAKRLLRIRNYFKAFINFCRQRYKIRDLLKGVATPNRKDQEREYVTWTKEEFEKFISCVDDLRYKAIFTTFYYSGIREGELQALTPADFKKNALKITKTYTRKTIDGSVYKITDTKNHKEHTVPVPQQVIVIIEKWLEYKKENHLPNNFLFGGEHPISQGALQYAWHKGIEKSGVERMRMHDLRHSYASLLNSNGANLAVIAQLLGDTKEQVAKTYAHAFKEDIDTAIKLL